eukprot:CAMPEP_0168327590 /NCGR_PEP_ID=MMETSP0213-20121227/5980_1 /TAXON_ID=151035 /ORGANISM="Euplotes harpa, Strain FSP1.4" /LENGTH=503 /DNA_ID=CAMNT_0008330507 /DNA_START=665 /DNA_END=2178 /DNA_ORIENTATION=-
MCCLEPPFNGSSLHSLALNIVRGVYNPIPKKYSSKLSLLLKKLLNPNTEERPTINKILKIDIIADRAKQLLNESEYIQEFSHTVLHDKNIFKQTNYAQESSKPAKVSRTKSNLQDPGYDAAINSAKDKALIGGEKRKKTIKKSQSETVQMTETERYEQNPMDYVNNVLGDLRQKLSLDDSEAAKPTREVRAGIRKPKPSGPSAISGAKKASQWEIREEIAKKKREEIMQEVRRKREREEEMKARAEANKKLELEAKEKDKEERVKKREQERKKMLEDRKKAMKKVKAKPKVEFEFVGMEEEEEKEDAGFEERDEEKEEEKEVKDATFAQGADFKGQSEMKDEDAANLIEKWYAEYVLDIEGFLDDENISDEEEPVTVSETPKFLHLSSSEDRDNVYNNLDDVSLDQHGDDSIKNVKSAPITKPQPTEDSSNWDYFALLTDKYGYENFKKGLEIVGKNHMLRFSEDGEQKIKKELEKIVGDNVETFYADCSSYIIMTASLGKFY